MRCLTGQILTSEMNHQIHLPFESSNSSLFNFEVVHVAGSTLGMEDYLSRHPTDLQGSSVKAETLWNERFTINSVISLNDVIDNSEASSRKKSAGGKCELSYRCQPHESRKSTTANQNAGRT